MSTKTKTREITITDEGGTFAIFFKKFSGEKENYDFEGISAFRQLLSNEKARILHTLKTKKPGSLYHLAKLLGRDFKAVHEDLKLLERFGFIELIFEKTGKRERIKPVVVIDTLNIKISV
ncbi:ArsR family transcriptional regulator [Candidatus Pacearchaeota archaeon]|nr:ArsR family transcriptional regulator [Candidatus Pacearchaeota archaeon]